MTFFLHVIVDMACAALAAAGFVAFHVNQRQPSTAIKIAGVILIATGLFAWAGNSYFGLKYMHAGYFDTPFGHECAMSKPEGGMPMSGMPMQGSNMMPRKE